MATLLSTLKLVTATRATQTSPAIQRRQKLIAKIDEQICLATAAMDGTEFKPTKFKNIVNAETGETEYKQVAKKLRIWWWRNEAGKVNLFCVMAHALLNWLKAKIVLNLKMKLPFCQRWI
jgi:hypothetical protein